MNANQELSLSATRVTKSRPSMTVATLVVLLSVGMAAEARDRPGTPTDVAARNSGATTVSLSWRNTARRDEHGKIELEPTKNGAHEFRICAVNSGGRTCAMPVAPVIEEPPLSVTYVPHPDKRVVAGTGPATDTGAVSHAAIKGTACNPGFVWRMATAQDRVCVTSAARSRIARENAEAASRIYPAGAYGPNTCIAGFVWRAAFTGDVVCVTPEARTLARQENSEALSRQGNALPSSLVLPAQSTSTAGDARMPLPRYVVPPPKILAPAAGSSVEKGRLHVQVKPAGGFIARQAEVEFVWQPLSPKPDAMLVASPGLWAVPMSQLASGVAVPEASRPQTAGRWIVRVRSADGAPGAWSEAVAFNLIANTASSKPNQEVPTSVSKPAGLTATETVKVYRQERRRPAGS